MSSTTSTSSNGSSVWGGMGVVAAARHVELGQQVALKFMLPQALAVLVQWNASCAKPDPSFSCRAST